MKGSALVGFGQLLDLELGKYLLIQPLTSKYIPELKPICFNVIYLNGFD